MPHAPILQYTQANYIQCLAKRFGTSEDREPFFFTAISNLSDFDGLKRGSYIANALINVIYGSVETMPLSGVIKNIKKKKSKIFRPKRKLTVHKDSSEKQASCQISEKNFATTSAGLTGHLRREGEPIIQFTGKLHHGMACLATAIGNT